MSLNRASTQSLRMAERDGALLEQPAARTYEREDGLGSVKLRRARLSWPRRQAALLFFRSAITPSDRGAMEPW
jgi:hypothetical protein